MGFALGAVVNIMIHVCQFVLAQLYSQFLQQKMIHLLTWKKKFSFQQCDKKRLDNFTWLNIILLFFFFLENYDYKWKDKPYLKALSHLPTQFSRQLISIAKKCNYVTSLGNAFTCFKKTDITCSVIHAVSQDKMFLCTSLPTASYSVPSMLTALQTNSQGSGFAVHEGLVAGYGNPV